MPSQPNPPYDKNPHGEIIRARKQFCDQAISGALNLISPWSQTPALAAEIFEKSLLSCKETLSAPPLGKSAQTGHMPKLSLLVANRGATLDAELSASPRGKPASDLWRSMVVDAFVKTSDGLEPKQRISLSGAGPAWLLEGLLAAIPFDDASRWAAAEQLSAKIPAKLAHASACLPAGASLLQVIPGSSQGRCCVGWAASEWARLKTEAISKLGSTGSFPTSAAQSGLDHMGRRIWTDDASVKELRASFSKITAAPVDLRSALLCLLARPEKMPKPNESWLAKLPPGSLSANDALAGLLIAPSDSLLFAAKAAQALSEPNPKALLACLLRLCGAPKALRPELAQICHDMLLSIVDRDPALANAVVLNEKGAPIKGSSLCSNVFECALKAAIGNKISTSPECQETLCVTAILEKLSELGFDMEATGPGGSSSCMAKLKALKSAEAKSWLAWAESIQIRASLAPMENSSADGPGRKPRL